jgi:hypothetical protein
MASDQLAAVLLRVVATVVITTGFEWQTTDVTSVLQ